MRKYISLILLIVSIGIFTSCITERRCAEKYPTPIIKKDSIVYKTKLKTVIIHDTIKIKADSASGHSIIDTTGGYIKAHPILKNTEYCKAIASITNNTLNLNLYQKDSTIARLLKNNVKIVEKTHTITNTIIKKVWVTHWYYKAAMWFSGIMILLIIASIVLQIIKGSFIKFIK